MAFCRCHQAYRHTFLASTAGTAHAVHVDFRITRQLHVDDHVQAIDIQAARGHVGGHQHRAAAVGEHGQYLVTVALLQVTVQGLGDDALGRQVGNHVLALLLGEAERHAGLRAVVAEHTGDGFKAVLWVDLDEALFDLVVGVKALDLDLLRVAHEVGGQLLDAGRVGGREQQGLAA